MDPSVSGQGARREQGADSDRIVIPVGFLRGLRMGRLGVGESLAVWLGVLLLLLGLLVAIVRSLIMIVR